MKRQTKWFMLALVPVLMALPARSCGPDFPEAIFVRHSGPDLPYATFAGGRLGVLQSGYSTRSLAVAYDWLTQRPLTLTEQKQAGAVDAMFLSYSNTMFSPDAARQGFTTWIKARASFGPVDGYTPNDKLDTDHQIADNSYDNFTNCLDDAFGNAARTLSSRVQAHGSKDAAVIEWVRGQDAVFTNCSGLKHYAYVDPNQPPAAPPRQPQPVANAAAWLRQDRDYQIAATHFYAMEFDAAITGFRAIAADKTSPWSTVARYLVARAMIRRATLGYSQTANAVHYDRDKMPTAQGHMLSGLNDAKKELQAMRADPHMVSMRQQVEALIDLINARVEPNQQALVLAARLHGHDSTAFDQNLIDLTYILSDDHDSPTSSPVLHKSDAEGMLDWIDAVSKKDKTASLQQWHSTKRTPWLLAAMMSTQPEDATAPELIRAATSVPSSDPAYVAVTYHRLRLMPRDAKMREALLAVQPSIEKQQGPSTTNLFASLDSATAPTMEAWLAQAGRLPAGETTLDDGDAALNTQPVEQACGPKLSPKSIHLFTPEAADTLNTEMPLEILAKAAESSVLPPNLRFQVAQAAWTRAVLLDRPEIAHRMTPLLENCRATWKPVLTDYDSATTPLDRKATGLLALMRFASTEPNVRGGEERPEGFATYSEFRDNWWCSISTDTNTPADGSSNTPRKTPAALPLFLTAEDSATAKRELAAMIKGKDTSASTYFATEALTWLHAHPKDPRTADILGEANRVLRNSCGYEKITPPLAHALFDAIHKNFPQSTWAKKYPTWE
jgi:hypothetical protein